MQGQTAAQLCLRQLPIQGEGASSKKCMSPPPRFVSLGSVASSLAAGRAILTAEQAVIAARSGAVPLVARALASRELAELLRGTPKGLNQMCES